VFYANLQVRGGLAVIKVSIMNSICCLYHGSTKTTRQAKELLRKPAKIITSRSDLADLFRGLKTVAVVGLSPKPERDSYRVARYLQQQGIAIIPIRPGQKEILGATAYPSLDDVPVPVDIVDVFRSSDKVLAHAHEALRLKPGAFWMQLNIENLEAADLLTAAGIDVVMNRCIKIEHARRFNRCSK